MIEKQTSRTELPDRTTSELDALRAPKLPILGNRRSLAQLLGFVLGSSAAISSTNAQNTDPLSPLFEPPPARMSVSEAPKNIPLIERQSTKDLFVQECLMQPYKYHALKAYYDGYLKASKNGELGLPQVNIDQVYIRDVTNVLKESFKAHYEYINGTSWPGDVDVSDLFELGSSSVSIPLISGSLQYIAMGFQQASHSPQNVTDRKADGAANWTMVIPDVEGKTTEEVVGDLYSMVEALHADPTYKADANYAWKRLVGTQIQFKPGMTAHAALEEFRAKDPHGAKMLENVYEMVELRQTVASSQASIDEIKSRLQNTNQKDAEQRERLVKAEADVEAAKQRLAKIEVTVKQEVEEKLKEALGQADEARKAFASLMTEVANDPKYRGMSPKEIIEAIKANRKFQEIRETVDALDAFGNAASSWLRIVDPRIGEGVRAIIDIGKAIIAIRIDPSSFTPWGALFTAVGNMVAIFVNSDSGAWEEEVLNRLSAIYYEVTSLRQDLYIASAGITAEIRANREILVSIGQRVDYLIDLTEGLNLATRDLASMLNDFSLKQDILVAENYQANRDSSSQLFNERSKRQQVDGSQAPEYIDTFMGHAQVTARTPIFTGASIEVSEENYHTLASVVAARGLQNLPALPHVFLKDVLRYDTGVQTGRAREIAPLTPSAPVTKEALNANSIIRNPVISNPAAYVAAVDAILNARTSWSTHHMRPRDDDIRTLIKVGEDMLEADRRLLTPQALETLVARYNRDLQSVLDILATVPSNQTIRTQLNIGGDVYPGVGLYQFQWPSARIFGGDPGPEYLPQAPGVAFALEIDKKSWTDKLTATLYFDQRTEHGGVHGDWYGPMFEGARSAMHPILNFNLSTRALHFFEEGRLASALYSNSDKDPFKNFQLAGRWTPFIVKTKTQEVLQSEKGNERIYRIGMYAQVGMQFDIYFPNLGIYNRRDTPLLSIIIRPHKWYQYQDLRGHQFHVGGRWGDIMAGLGWDQEPNFMRNNPPPLEQFKSTKQAQDFFEAVMRDALEFKDKLEKPLPDFDQGNLITAILGSLDFNELSEHEYDVRSVNLGFNAFPLDGVESIKTCPIQYSKGQSVLTISTRENIRSNERYDSEGNLKISEDIDPQDVTTIQVDERHSLTLTGYEPFIAHEFQPFVVGIQSRFGKGTGLEEECESALQIKENELLKVVMNTAVSPASDLNRAFKRLEFSRAMLRSVFLMSAGETVKDNPELNPLCGKIMGMDRIVRELNFPLWLHSQLGLPSDVSFPYDELIQTITSQAEETKAIIATLMLAVTEAQTQPDQNDWAPSPNEVKQTSLPPGMGNSAVRSAIERLRAALPD